MAVASSKLKFLQHFWHPERGWHFPFVFKIGMAIGLMSILGAGMLGFMTSRQHVSLIERQGDAFGQTIVEQLAASIVEPVFADDHLSLQLLLNQLSANHNVYGAAVYDPDGVLLSQSGQIRSMVSAAAPFDAEQLVLPQGYYKAPVIFSGVQGAVAVVSINQASIRFAILNSGRDFLIATIVICGVSVLGAYIFSRRLSRPMYRLLAMSKAAKSGHIPGVGAEKMSSEWAEIMELVSKLGDEMESKRSVENLLQRFVATDVAEKLLSGKDLLQLGGESVEATVLFVDIVEFTSMSEKMTPREVADLLNQYLSIFASCAQAYMGSVDKFIGDAAMVVFGAPRPDDDHRFHAIACAMLIQEMAQRLNEMRCRQGMPLVRLRAGVNSGPMQAGILGSEHRMEYTVVGDAVNMASRLCDEAGPGEVLISSDVYDASVRDRIGVEDAGMVQVKGKTQAIKLFTVTHVDESRSQAIASLVEEMVQFQS